MNLNRRYPLRHRPNLLRSYQEIHETVMSRFRDAKFIKTDNLCFSAKSYGFVLAGQIACAGQIIITVEKFLRELDRVGQDVQVVTAWYSYNVSLQSRGNIWRFDNQDELWRDGHLDRHHQHYFDWVTGEEKPGSPVWIGEDNWPTLGDVLCLTKDWYWRNRDHLPCPDAYASISATYTRRASQDPPSLEISTPRARRSPDPSISILEVSLLDLLEQVKSRQISMLALKYVADPTEGIPPLVLWIPSLSEAMQML